MSRIGTSRVPGDRERERGCDLNENDADELGEDDGEVGEGGVTRSCVSRLSRRPRDPLDDQDDDLVHDNGNEDVL